MSPIPQTSFLVGTFFAVSYSKPALEHISWPSLQNMEIYNLSCEEDGYVLFPKLGY